MKFNLENRTEVFQKHIQKVTNIGIPANAAKATVGFEDREVFRTYLVDEFGEGKNTKYSPKINVTIDKDGYIGFEPTREEVEEFFKDHLGKFKWSVMSDTDLQLAKFDVRNFMNADSQIVIDDNKKLTGFQSAARISTIQLLGMQKIDFLLNFNGNHTASTLDEMNAKLRTRDNQKWQFFGKKKALAVKIDTATETRVKNGKTYVADPEQAVRLLAVQELADLCDELAGQYNSVEYSAQDTVVMKELRGNDISVATASNILRSLFGEYYSLIIFAEEFAKDLFAKENEDEYLEDSFGDLELAAELSDQKQKDLAKFSNMALNTLSTIDAKSFAANMLWAAKRGNLNVTGGGSTLLTTSFPKHAYLLTEEFSKKNEDGEWSKLSPAKYAGEKIQTFNNETFKDGQEVQIVGTTSIKGYKSSIIKPIEFKDETPKTFVKYFNDKPHVVYDFMEQLNKSIQKDKEEAALDPKALISVDFGGAFAFYDKDNAVVDYGESQEVISKIHSVVMDGKELIVSYDRGEYAAFVEKDGELELLCHLKSQPPRKDGKDFGPGSLKPYLHKSIIKIEEDYTGVIGSNQSVKRGRAAMVMIGSIVGKYEKPIPTIHDIDVFEEEYEEELKSVIIVEDEGFENIFGGNVTFEIEDSEGNKSTISTGSDDNDDLIGDEFESVYDDIEEDSNEEDEGYELEY